MKFEKNAIKISKNEEEGGGGQGPFGTFLKINPLWRRHPSLTIVDE